MAGVRPTRFRQASVSSSSTSGPDSPNVEVAPSARDQLTKSVNKLSDRRGAGLSDSRYTGAYTAQEASEAEFSNSNTSLIDRDRQPFHLVIADNLASLIRDAAQRTTELAASSIPNVGLKPLSRHLSVSSLSACETDSTCTAFDSRVSSIAMSRTTSLPLLAGPVGDIPSIDPHVIKDLETHAKRISFSVTQLLNQVRVAMHQVSAVTVCGLQTYEEAAIRTCDTVDGCIRAMYAAMARCDQLAIEMTRVGSLHTQLRDVARQLDALETACNVKRVQPPGVTPSRSFK